MTSEPISAKIVVSAIGRKSRPTGPRGVDRKERRDDDGDGVEDRAVHLGGRGVTITPDAGRLPSRR